jgi:hypothetical protein
MMIRRQLQQSTMLISRRVLWCAVACIATLAHANVDSMDAGSLMDRLFHSSSSTKRATPNSGTTSSVNRHHRQRKLQDEVNQTEPPVSNNNATAAYFKCYSLIDEVTTDADSELRQEEYLEFLRLLTDGAVAYDRFQDLPAIYVMIFYTAACAEGDDCEPGNTPAIRITETDTGEPSEIVQLFCKQILKNTSSSAEAVFDYSIRYNPDRIAQQDLAICLSTATVNILLEQLAMCPLLPQGDEAPTDRRQLLWQSHSGVVGSNSATGEVELSLGSRALSSTLDLHDLRRLQSLGSVSTPDDSTCKYSITSTVDRIADLRTYGFCPQREKFLPLPMYPNFAFSLRILANKCFLSRSLRRNSRRRGGKYHR